MLFLYRLLTFILSFFLPIYLFCRVIKKKEEPNRLKERYGISNIKRPSGKLIWIHAVSVGETMSVIVLVNHLIEKYNYNVLLTTNTVTSANLAATKLPSSAIHQYIPIDIARYIKRFLKHWKPNAVIFVEEEIWPNAITLANKIAPLYLINARLSKRSKSLWEKFPLFFKKIMNKYKVIAAAGSRDLKNFYQFKLPNLHYWGHTKYDAAMEMSISLLKSMDSDKMQKIQSFIDPSKVKIIFGSTHGEENFIAIRTYLELKKQNHNVQIILAPRHFSYLPKIQHNIQFHNLRASYLSEIINKPDLPIQFSDIIVVDVMGELFSLYYFSDIAIIGGSFIEKIGGHNPLEPAILGKAVVVGPYHDNIEEICEDMINDNAIKIANDGKDLVFILSQLITNNNFITVGKNASAFTKQKTGATELIALSISKNAKK